MGVAALVLGIVSVVIGFIPFCGTWALIPAIVGLVLGIIDWVKKKKANQPKGKAIAGTICSGVAIVIILVWWLIFGIAANKTAKAIKDYDWNSVDWNTTVDDADWDSIFDDED